MLNVIMLRFAYVVVLNVVMLSVMVLSEKIAEHFER